MVGRWFLTVLLLANVAVAEIYTWKDERGKTRFSDVPPPEDKAAATVKLQQTNKANAVTVPKKSTAPKPKSATDKKPLAAGKDKNAQLAAYCEQMETRYKSMTGFISGAAGNSTGDTDCMNRSTYRQRNGKSAKEFCNVRPLREKNREAEDMRLEANRRGCNIQQTKNLKL